MLPQAQDKLVRTGPHSRDCSIREAKQAGQRPNYQVRLIVAALPMPLSMLRYRYHGLGFEQLCFTPRHVR